MLLPVSSLGDKGTPAVSPGHFFLRLHSGQYPRRGLNSAVAKRIFPCPSIVRRSRIPLPVQRSAGTGKAPRPARLCGTIARTGRRYSQQRGQVLRGSAAAAEPVRRRGRLPFREWRGDARPRVSRTPTRPIAKRVGAAWVRRRNLAARDLPPIITMAVSEMGMSANQSLAMYPMLTAGAYGALLETGARLDETAYRAQDGVRRMGRHHVPDRAGLRAPICG